MMGIGIYSVTDITIDQARKILSETYDTGLNNHIHNKDTYLSEEKMRTHLGQNGNILFYEVDGRKVATLSICYEELSSRVKKYLDENEIAEIRYVAVIPAFQRMGIAEKLVKEAIRLNGGSKKMLVNTSYENIQAIQLYKKCQFNALAVYYSGDHYTIYLLHGDKCSRFKYLMSYIIACLKKARIHF